jgi:uncharacterized membrane protein
LRDRYLDLIANAIRVKRPAWFTGTWNVLLLIAQLLVHVGLALAANKEVRFLAGSVILLSNSGEDIRTLKM